MTAAASIARAPRSLALNSLAQVGGRLLLSIARLGGAMLIVRLFGTETFGQYALLFGFIAIFEWLADFGQTDIAVREICANPERAEAALAALVRLKRLLAPLLAVLLPAAVALLGYGHAIAWAGAAAGPGIAAYALLQTGRARLKAGMRQDLDIAAEIAGVATLLAGTALAGAAALPIVGLGAVYAASRIVHAGLVVWWCGGRAPAVAASGLSRAMLRSAAPIGFAGLIVAIYEGLAPIMLARLATMADVAAYAAAARFAMPVLTIMQALGSAFFPVLARERADPARLGQTQGAVMWLTLLVAGGLASGIAGGSDFLLGLFGKGLAGNAHVLGAMCWLVFARAFTQALSPLVVIGGAQRTGLWLTMTAVIAQAVAIPLLVPRLGVIGVVAGYIAIECLLGFVPVGWLGLRATGIAFDRPAALPLLGAGVATLAAAPWLPLAGSLAGGVMAGALFLALAAATGGLTQKRLRQVAAALHKRGEAA